LVVLITGKGSDAGWMAAQDRTATLSTNSVHRIIPGATYEALVADRTDAAVSAQGVLESSLWFATTAKFTGEASSGAARVRGPHAI
jgi:hypothetical protein